MGNFLKKLIDNAPVVGPAVVAGNKLIHGNAPSFSNFMDINPVFQGMRLGEPMLRHVPVLNQLDPVAYLQGVPAGLKAASTGRVDTIPRDATVSHIPEAANNPTDRGSVGASPTGQPGPSRSDSHNTAWDTDPMYAVVSRLTQKDYQTMFKGMTDATTLTNKATSVVLQKLSEAGYKIDANAAKVFTDGAEQTMTAWYQANTKANGHPPSMTEYFEALTRAALLSRGQTPGDTGTTGTTSDTTSGANGLGTTTNFVGSADRAAADPNQSPTVSQSAGLTQEQQQTPGVTDFGTHVYAKTEDANNASITVNSPEAQQGGGVWMSGKGGWLDDPTVYSAYVGFLLGADQQRNPDGTQATVDRSVDAFNKFFNVDATYKLWQAQQKGG